MYFIIIYYLLLGLVTAISNGDRPCKKLDTKYGHVCVCNADYCDTINPPTKLPKGQFHVYYTSKNSPGFNHYLGNFRMRSFSNYVHKYDVNTSYTFQTLQGFGGAFTDLFGSAFNTLSHSVQKNLIRSFFSEEGIEYNTCRIVLGSSDFSLRNYTYLSHNDVSLKSFNLTEDDYLYKIPQIKWALNVTKRHLNFLGSTWTSPSWMKTNNKVTAGFLKSEYYQVWADYYIKTLEAFKKEGIDFWGLTAGNEPITLYSVKNLPSLAMFPEEQREWFFNNLGPSLKKANFNTKFFFLDDMRAYATWWMDTIMRDTRVNLYSTGLALHWYVDSFISTKELDKVHEKFPEQELIYTESSINVVINAIFGGDDTRTSDFHEMIGNDGGVPQLGSWRRAAMYAANIIENLNHWVTTYIDWNLALNINGGPNLLNSSCDASIIINEHNNVFYKQPMYYVMGHFSKFMAPGSVVIGVHRSNEKTDFVELERLKESVNETKTLSYQQKPHRLMFPVNLNIQHVAALNPDGSYTIIFYNPKNVTVEVAVHIPERGYAFLSLNANSINSLIYW